MKAFKQDHQLKDQIWVIASKNEENLGEEKGLKK